MDQKKLDAIKGDMGMNDNVDTVGGPESQYDETLNMTSPEQYEMKTPSLADLVKTGKLGAIKGELGVSEPDNQQQAPKDTRKANNADIHRKTKADGDTATPEGKEPANYTQKGIHKAIGGTEDDIYPEGTGATAGGEQEYDFYCPDHMVFVRGNVCPVEGHKIDNRFFIDPDKKVLIGKVMTGELTLEKPEVQKSLKPDFNPEGLGRRDKIDLIKSDLGIGKLKAKPETESIADQYEDTMNEAIHKLKGINKSIAPEQLKRFSKALAAIGDRVNNASVKKQPAIMEASITILKELIRTVK